jgi:hypothetical protein
MTMAQALIRPPHKDRKGQWRCLACGTWLKNSLEIWVHVGAHGPTAMALVRRGGLACVREGVVFECTEHGQEAP